MSGTWDGVAAAAAYLRRQADKTGIGCDESSLPVLICCGLSFPGTEGAAMRRNEGKKGLQSIRGGKRKRHVAGGRTE